MSIGLYPSPPNLTRPEDERANSAPRQFWIIKHGIKTSGMPAWGPTNDDQRIMGNGGIYSKATVINTGAKLK